MLKMGSDDNKGLVLSTNDIASGKFTYSSLGMPRVLPPGKADEDWLLWLHARDDTLADDVVKLSTGRIIFGTILCPNVVDKCTSIDIVSKCSR
jgi:hypothetical protein